MKLITYGMYTLRTYELSKVKGMMSNSLLKGLPHLEVHEYIVYVGC